ncbi:hypothetical protein E3T32_12535 [Cryobacterium sp. TMT2-23]|nr:hypothetical protein E3T32_12535 [Cryobacterium sp. TMT2-23]
MIENYDSVDVFIGVDVGKGEHHAVALDRAGIHLWCAATRSSQQRSIQPSRSAVEGVPSPLGLSGVPVAVRHPLLARANAVWSPRSGYSFRSNMGMGLRKPWVKACRCTKSTCVQSGPPSRLRLDARTFMHRLLRRDRPRWVEVGRYN